MSGTDQDGGKLAMVEFNGGRGETKQWAVTLPPNRNWPLCWEATEEAANQLADTINAADQAALTAERKRVLEMVIKEIGADSGFPELASTIRALLSRLEGEGGKQ